MGNTVFYESEKNICFHSPLASEPWTSGHAWNFKTILAWLVHESMIEGGSEEHVTEPPRVE